MKKTLITIGLVVSAATLMAQTFDMSAQVRPRFESKHGFKTLTPINGVGSNFISQRTRLNFGYKNTKIKFGLTLQNVRVWGDVGTLSSRDLGNSFHQAWAEVKLAKKIALKLGRQEIVYDDSRIFGNAGWAQQARSHDAAILKFKANDKHKVDFGLALNSDNQGGAKALYSNVAGYKSFQYIHYHGTVAKGLELSFLVLNTGVEYIKPIPTDSMNQQIDNMQTIGPRLTYKKGKFSANLASYVQVGKLKNIDVNSLYVGANIGYKFNKNWNVGAGVEYLSGKANNDTTIGITSFNPVFGTNHKFNGCMDYFYVGNHGNNVGLMDINFTLAYSKNKFSAKVIPHLFSSAATIHDVANNKDLTANLGTEIDVVLGYKIAKDITMKAGFSMMLASESMEYLKGTSTQANNWTWVMFTFNPKLFSYTVAKKVVAKKL